MLLVDSADDFPSHFTQAFSKRGDRFIQRGRHRLQFSGAQRQGCGQIIERDPGGPVPIISGTQRSRLIAHDNGTTGDKNLFPTVFKTNGVCINPLREFRDHGITTIQQVIGLTG